MRVAAPQELQTLQDHMRLYFHKIREPCPQGHECLIQGAHTSEYIHPCPYVHHIFTTTLCLLITTT
jgi:hypothetical protein